MIIFYLIKTILFCQLIHPFFANSFTAINYKQVIVILADDLGPHQITKEITPFLYDLKNNNLYYDRFVTNPRCTPTRTSFLNGYSSARIGINYAYNCLLTEIGGNISSKDLTVPELLQNKGIKTGVVGKWHIGETPIDHPLRNGYDYFFGCLSGAIDYNSHIDICGSHDLYENYQELHLQGYFTDLVLIKTIQFLYKNKKSNFFLYVPFTTPHWWLQKPGEIYRSVGGALTDEFQKYMVTQERMNYMLSSLDNAVKRIYESAPPNSLIIFLGDNGPEKKFKSNLLRGFKGTSYNGGINTPLIVAKKDQDFFGRNNLLFNILDLSVSILKYFGINKTSKMEGKQVRFDKVLGGTEEFFIKNEGGNEVNHDSCIITSKWKLFMGKNGVELYNMKNDWEEKNDLSGKFPGIVDSLKLRYSEWNSMNKNILN